MARDSAIRCRPIAAADIEQVGALLARGFPLRPLGYWRAGLERLRTRSAPDSYPRFGFLLEQDNRIAGALLTIFQALGPDTGVRCNLASWYVEPALRSHAALLGRMPMRFKEATLLNASAAPNTWATIEAQGFKRYTAGQHFALPVLATGGRGWRVEPFRPADPVHAALPEAALLADHAATGCLSLVASGPDGAEPVVLLPLRARQGRLPFPGAQVVYCRGVDGLARFARPLGLHLAARGRPVLVVDAIASLPGLPGRFWPGRARKYARGPHLPRLGDLAYTEFTLFGA